MKTLKISLFAVLFSAGAFAQQTTPSTTLSSAVVAGTNTQWCLASASNVVLPSQSGGPGSYLFVDQEAAQVTATGSTSTCFKVKRGQLGTSAGSAHASGAVVWVGQAATGSGDSSRPFGGAFVNGRPNGPCVASTLYTLPVIVAGGLQGGEIINCTGPVGSQVWTTVNPLRFINVGAAIASASVIAPVSYVTHVTGTTAINTITVPTGFVNGGEIKIIPDGIFTTTTSGNIAIASTAVVGKALIFTYDATTAKWYPSY